ncbi:MAG: aminoacyl-tRNA hydrolase [Candidatus Cloacimonetes bacterium]|nr:aminoacyl-tRNA hydrolase [Candidatus Cloacimonadota bacterium]
MKLIVGLGNPGLKYKNNRHNIGFLIADYFAKSNNIKFKSAKRYKWLEIDNTIIIKPKTFMNLSGSAVLSVLSQFQIDDILVLVDDIYLSIGNFRLRKTGGDGGHNGLKSIYNAIGNYDFKRMRIGIGLPDSNSLSNHVLSNFSKDENKILSEVLKLSKELLKEYINKDFDDVLNYYSKIKVSYSKKIEELRINSPQEEK